MEKRFKYDLETIYKKANELAKEYQGEGKTDTEKNFILAELLEVTEELILNQCQKFLKGKSKFVTVDDLYSIAITEALMDVLDWYDFSQGDNIVVAWISFMEKRFYNALNKECTNKAIWHRTRVYSADKALNSDGTTIYELMGESDFAKKICADVSMGELVNKFENIDKHGKIIRCLLIGNQSLRTKAFLKVLGAESYAENERKAVERTKKRFAKFLIRNGYDLTGYNIEKFI